MSAKFILIYMIFVFKGFFLYFWFIILHICLVNFLQVCFSLLDRLSDRGNVKFLCKHVVVSNIVLANIGVVLKDFLKINVRI